MTRYYFHFRHPRRSLMDCEGMMLADAAGARNEATLIARDLRDRRSGRILPEWGGWTIEVCDQRGRHVLGLRLEDALEDGVDPAEVRSSPKVVYLDETRARLQLSALKNQTRNLKREAALLSDRQRYAVSGLRHEISLAQDVTRQSRDLLARSQQRARASNRLAVEAQSGGK
jgi:hypothetical protein